MINFFLGWMIGFAMALHLAKWLRDKDNEEKWL